MSLQLPLFEYPSTWKPPSMADLPSWKGAKRIGLDIETCDPNLKETGPSVRTGGYIAGVSFAIEDGPQFYLPIRHEGGDNLPEDQVLAYLRDNGQCFDGTLVGANFNYDLDYLEESGITFPKTEWKRDIQIADPLINELHRSYSMQAIAERWGIPGKDEELLRGAAKHYGVSPKSGMYRLPARFVGDYAEHDARLPLQLLRRQERAIDEMGMWDIYNLESEVQAVALKMRRRGVKIDTVALGRIHDWTIKEETAALRRVKKATGVTIPLGEIWTKDLTAKALGVIGVTLKQTATGQDQIDKELLESIEHPVADDILHARKVNKLRTTFVESINTHMVNGRIHCTFNQMRRTKEDGDTKGARYGRMSSEHPNLQQQPSRDEFAKMWRSIYIPDDPSLLWLSADYSQQEPRMLTHFAELCGLQGAKAAADKYRNDPSTDNHQMMADLCNIPRTPAKDLFLGVCYGQGGASVAKKLGLPTKWKELRNGRTIEVADKEAQQLLDIFDRRAPYVRQLAKRCEATARQRGFIRTLLGRRCHFPKKADGSYDWCHKALNRLIQGSAADQTKRAMVDVDKAGLPSQLQVHDELCASGTMAQGEQMVEVMVDCVPLNVPSKVDLETGPSWGEAA